MSSQVLRVVCPNCRTSLKLPDPFVGKSAKCPKCSAKFTVGSGATASTAPKAQSLAKTEPLQSPSHAHHWFAMLAGGYQYGPFTKSELDRWVRLREFSPPRGVRRVPSQQWQSVDAIYPELATPSRQTAS